MTPPPRGDLRKALDRDLSKLRRAGTLRGRDTLVRLARDLADRYDDSHGVDLYADLLALLDRLTAGKVPLLEVADEFTMMSKELEGVD